MMDDTRESVMAGQAREFAHKMFEPLCSRPQDLSVEVFETPHRLTLVPKCDPEDAGKLIGNKGETFRACKALAEAWGGLYAGGKAVEVGSVKTTNGQRRRARYNGSKRDWDQRRWHGVMEEAAELLVGEHRTEESGTDTLSVTYWAAPESVTDRDARAAAAVLDAYGRAVAKTLCGEAAVDVGVDGRR